MLALNKMPDIFNRISRTDVAIKNLKQQEELIAGFKEAGVPRSTGTVSDRAIKFVSLVTNNEPFLRYCQLPQATLPALHDAMIGIENQNLIFNHLRMTTICAEG